MVPAAHLSSIRFVFGTCLQRVWRCLQRVSGCLLMPGEKASAVVGRVPTARWDGACNLSRGTRCFFEGDPQRIWMIAAVCWGGMRVVFLGRVRVFRSPTMCSGLYPQRIEGIHGIFEGFCSVFEGTRSELCGREGYFPVGTGCILVGKRIRWCPPRVQVLHGVLGLKRDYPPHVCGVSPASLGVLAGVLREVVSAVC